jgi:hypothetical protein
MGVVDDGWGVMAVDGQEKEEQKEKNWDGRKGGAGPRWMGPYRKDGYYLSSRRGWRWNWVFGIRVILIFFGPFF